MNILIACEFSGIVRDAFIDRGFNAVSCDLLKSESDRGKHYQGDVISFLERYANKIDLMIAHPPCTYLCNSGVRWLHEDKARWAKMKKGALFFKKLFNYDIPHVAIENPVMHGYAVKIIGKKQNFTFQPWEFGDLERKLTCFWTKNLPSLISKYYIPQGKLNASVHKEGPSIYRWKNRSRTFTGVAKAIAKQWGDYISE